MSEQNKSGEVKFEASAGPITYKVTVGGETVAEVSYSAKVALAEDTLPDLVEVFFRVTDKVKTLVDAHKRKIASGQMK